jgi:hypothetical protein
LREAEIVIHPGRPFWSAVAGFGASMVSLFGMDQFHVTTFVDVSVNLGGALVISLFVFITVYAQGKVAEISERRD